MILAILFVFLFGSAIGSFLNVVILRLHQGKKLDGRSQCPHCHNQLKALDLVPILSFLLLSGKCRYCHHKLSIQYPVVELSTAALFTFAFLNLESGTMNQANLPFLILNSLFIVLVISVLIIISVYDLRWGLIPDKVIFPASIVAIIYQIILAFINIPVSENSLFMIHNSLFSAPVTQLLLNLVTALVIGIFFLALIIGTRGRGMGGGDLKLSLFIGLALGWPLAVLAIFLGFLTGALAAVMLILLGRKSLKQTVPFGPFLALGSFLALVYGNQILELYLKSMGLN